MARDGILKNAKKFNNRVKLAKGLNLALAYTVNRPHSYPGAVGISTATFGDKWFYLPKGKALFKTYDSRYGKAIRKVRIYNELICQELCSQVGIKCAEYERADYKNVEGLVTYDISNGASLVSMRNFITKIDKESEINLNTCSKVIDKYIQEGYKLDKSSILLDLYKLIIFDTITMQTDRNTTNIYFLFNDGTYTFAPIIDNEFAFCGQRILDYIKDPETLQGYFFRLQSVHSSESSIFSFNGSYEDYNNFFNNIKNIVYYANKYPECNKALNDILENFNIEVAINTLNKKGIKINKSYKQFINKIVDGVKKEIEREKKEQREKALSEEKINNTSKEVVGQEEIKLS